MKWLIRKFKILQIKYSRHFWVWRVRFPDGQKTRLLGKEEATSVRAVFGGKMYADEKAIKLYL